MANGLYDAGRESFLQGFLDWTGHTIKAQLIDTANYTVNLASHNNFDDIPLTARVGEAVTLINKTATAGVADAENVTFPNVTGPTTEAVVIYRDTGIESTSTLIAYIHEAGGLPATPNGTNIVVVWDNGINKIFKL